jgi:hypothetical protein
MLLKQPTAIDAHIVFLYAGEIWIADRDGGGARRPWNGREGRLQLSIK